ncbi:MAG: protein kinase, partial [Propionibacteriaceae bacterium]
MTAQLDEQLRTVRGGLLRAVGDSLVLYDGSQLLHCVNPLEPNPVWERFADLAGEHIVALSSCADLNSTKDQLFAATAAGHLLSWTWRGADPSDPSGHGWYDWEPRSLETTPAAMASWSLSPGHQEVVIADQAGELWSQRREDWDSWSEWELIGVIRDVVTLDGLASANGTVELYAVSADGELKRKVQQSPLGNAPSWGGVEVVAGWADPAVGVMTWALPGEVENVAVLLASGALRQRWRRATAAGTSSDAAGPQWSDWWSTPAAPLESAAALAAWTTGGQQVIAALGGSDHLCLRPWHPTGGWRDWLPASQVSTQRVTEVINVANGSSAPPTPATPTPNQPTPPPEQIPPLHQREPEEIDTAPVVNAARAGEATVLFAGRELLPLSPQDPAQIGPFKLQKRIAGGQASTDKYVARDGRGYCFLKVVKPDTNPDEALAFRRESQMAAKVVDRHRLANFIDAHPGDESHRPYLALSYEQGKHLGELTDGRPLGAADLGRLAQSLFEALVELRDCGICHLDLKPANVVMRNGDYPVVVDFGSAVPADTTVVTEAAFGTVAYAAPEFAEGGRTVNSTTDTYSWGAVLVAAATGTTPSRDPQIRQEQLAKLPASLVAPVTAALADTPANRPSLDDLAKQLARTHPLDAGAGVIRRLPVDQLAPSALPARLRRTPDRIVAQLEALGPWA